MPETLPVKEGFFENRDGIKLAYQECGEGPPVILTNGLGGRWAAWYFMVRQFYKKFRFISWDYRGLYKSETPDNPDAQTVPDHAADMKDLLDYFGVRQAIFFGWSMGVQVNFEFFRYHPEMMRAIVAFDGTYGRPYDTAFNIPFSREILDQFFKFVGDHDTLSNKFMDAVTKLPIFFDAVKVIGLVAPSCDSGIFTEMASGFKNLDMSAYAKIMAKLADHDAFDVLSRINVPVLLVTGSKDIMTPLSVSKQIQKQIANCELKVLEGGTHYSPVEFPEETNKILNDFFEHNHLFGVANS